MQNSQVVIPQQYNVETGKNVLFLSDLPQKVTDLDLSMFFEDYKDKILVINFTSSGKYQDHYNPKSLCAKVIFKDFKAADDARRAKNMCKIKGKTIRVMWDERDNNLRYNSQTNLFIKNIPFEIKPREFYEFYLQFGDVCSSKMPEDEEGNHMGYGYINYYDAESASRAIQATDGKEVWGSKLEVKHFQKKNERLGGLPYANNNNIYIRNFPTEYSENEINKLCSQFGDILSTKISTDDSHRKFAIVSFVNEEAATNARHSLNGSKLGDGSELFVNHLMSKQEREKIRSHKILDNNYKLNEQYKYCNLHIRNIPYHAKEEDLSEAFKKFGEIKSVKIEKYVLVTKINNEMKEIPTSKGFGYVCFEDAESAKKALEEMNNKYLPNFETWNRPLLIDYFMPKNERTPVVVSKINQTNNFFNPKTPFMMNPLMGQGMPRFNMNIHPNMMNPKLMPGFPNMPGMFPEGVLIPPQMPPMKSHPHQGGFHHKDRKRPYQNAPRVQQQTQIQQQPQRKDDDQDIDFEYLNRIVENEGKKDYIGELLFKKIENHKISQDRSLTIDTIGKITGMILGIEDINEIVDIYRNPENLTSRISEALELILQKN